MIFKRFLLLLFFNKYKNMSNNIQNSKILLYHYRKVYISKKRLPNYSKFWKGYYNILFKLQSPLEKTEFIYWFLKIRKRWNLPQ